MITVSFYKKETVDFLQREAVAEYRAGHPEDAALSDADVLVRLPQDDQDLIREANELETLFAVMLPLLLLGFIAYEIGKVYGKARGNGIKAGPDQFGGVYALWVEMAGQLGMKKIPELYIENGNGVLNAYATCLPGYRPFGAIYSDILERALATGDETALRFILGHELGHIRFGHVSWWYILLTTAANLPGLSYFVGQPLSRAREYGCDKVGFTLSQDEECRGLMMLAAGKHLYRKVDMAVYQQQQTDTRSFWVSVHNFFQSHPVIAWRIDALRRRRHGDLFWQSRRRNVDAAPPAKNA